MNAAAVVTENGKRRSIQGQEAAFTSLFEANEIEEIFEHITEP